MLPLLYCQFFCQLAPCQLIIIRVSCAAKERCYPAASSRIAKSPITLTVLSLSLSTANPLPKSNTAWPLTGSTPTFFWQYLSSITAKLPHLLLSLGRVSLPNQLAATWHIILAVKITKSSWGERTNVNFTRTLCWCVHLLDCIGDCKKGR